MLYRILPKIFLAMSISFLASACSSTDRIRAPKNPNPVIEGEVTPEKAQLALEMKLKREIEYLQQNAERFKEQVVAVPINKSTYYYKYYDEFPEATEQIKITVTPTGSLSPAYTADAKYRKIRFQTRYSKSQGKAADDENFIQDEGIQQNSYAFEGNAWRLRSSVFEVTKTSIYREDQWVASHGRINRLEEEKPEYFVDKLRTLFGLLE